MNVFQQTGIALLTFVLMEAWAWWVHKYLLHGPLWFLHRTHHEPQKGWWEWNDLVSLLYGALSTGLVIYGAPQQTWHVGLGIGIALYGVFYFFFHDIIIHRRIKIRYKFTHPYVLRLIRAHKMHHKHMQRDHSEAFGFLYATRRYNIKRVD